MLDQCSKAFKQNRTWNLARQLAYGALTCLGRHTLTGILTACGKQFNDWSAAYKLFAKERIDNDYLFKVACCNTIQQLSIDQEVVAHMDDTIIKKTGKKVSGTAWRRDPLGPPFHTNLIWGQRFIQTSLALPGSSWISQSRAIPVDFHHCPTAKKPGKKGTEQDWKRYKEKQKQTKLSKKGAERISLLRKRLDQQGAQEKQLLLSVDGSYTNNTVLKSLPQRVTLIGRIRKDTCLYTLPDLSRKGVGRNRVYGDKLPTPQQIRQDDQIPWQKVRAWAAYKVHDFDVKVIKIVRWRAAGGQHDLQLVVIRPLGYRLTKNSKILYRKPAYLICTDPELSIEKLLQAYLWRWEIEVNFRDEKTVMGCGQAQVRNDKSVEKVPAFIAAMYAFMMLAAHKSASKDNALDLPRPLWYPKKKCQRQTIGDIRNLVRTQLWAKALGSNFSGFVNDQFQSKARRNKVEALPSALFYSRK